LMLMFFMLEVLACFLVEEGWGRVSSVFVSMVCSFGGGGGGGGVFLCFCVHGVLFSPPPPPNCVLLID
jgi:hypothetical protein